MARPLRIEFPGAVYHVTCRGNEQRDIYRDDEDRRKFLSILAESAGIYSIKLYAYVLMSNHFHLILETPLGNLSEFMRRFNITYTGYFNRRHDRAGHLYQGRYKSLLIDKATYLTIVSKYIHLNPVRIATMQEKSVEQRLDYLKAYRWSSLPGYLETKKKEGLIDYVTVLAEYGGDNRLGRANYGKSISEDVAGHLDIKKAVIGQSILGSKTFIEKMLGKEKKFSRRNREQPALAALSRYCEKEKIIKAIEKVTGKSLKEIREAGALDRQLAMEVLCCFGGLKGREVGEYFQVDYSTVSVSRKRLRARLEKDKALKGKYEEIVDLCQ